MFQICIDADHVNGKGLLKRGRGCTGKKHEEQESNFDDLLSHKKYLVNKPELKKLRNCRPL